MIATTNFFIWFFSGLGGIGGWLVFAALSFLSILFVFTSSLVRKMPALGWRLVALLLGLLILPAAVYRFLPNDIWENFNQYEEIIFYLGIIGGIVPLFVALGYLLRFQGMVVCAKGHAYDPRLGDCPHCIPMPDLPDISGSQDLVTELDIQPPQEGQAEGESQTGMADTEPAGMQEEGGYSAPVGGIRSDLADTEPMTEAGPAGIPGYGGAGADVADTMVEPREFVETQVGKVGLPFKSKQKAQGFLLLPDNHTYQLNQGITNIGRGSDNDFVFVNEFVSRSHARIVEEDRNLFRLHDLASANGTWLNGKRIKQSVLLESDDEIQFGDQVKVLFLTSSRR